MMSWRFKNNRSCTCALNREAAPLMMRFLSWIRLHAGAVLAGLVCLMAIIGIGIFILAFQECRFAPEAGVTWQYRLTTEIFAIEEDGKVGDRKAMSQHNMDMLCLNNDNDVALITAQQKAHGTVKEEISHLRISPKGQVSRYIEDELLNNSGQAVGHFFDFNLFPLPEGLEQSWTVPMVYSILPAQKNQVFANVKRIQNGSRPKFLMTFPPVAWVKRGPSDPYSQISDFRCEYVFDISRGLVEEANITFIFARERPYPQNIQQVQVRMALSLKDWGQFEDPIALRDTAMKTLQVQAELNAEHSERVRNILQRLPEAHRMHPALQRYLRAVTADLESLPRHRQQQLLQRSERPLLGQQTTQGNNGANPTTASAGSFALQIASIKKERRRAAEQEVAKLKRQGFKAFLDVRERHLVICIGPYQAKEQSVMSEFKQRYPNDKPFWTTIRQ